MDDDIVSFASFEEVFLTAKQLKVDFVLLAGDLFHENKPSRKTLHSSMEILRRYCFGGDDVFIQILNERGELFKTSFGKVNYEDPYQSICLPVFSIHGNHDDPSREGGSGEALAALDLLSVSNLINYIGKVDRVDSVEVSPILVSKGNTHLAIYALGAMRDERLNRMWNLKKVKFVRLTAEQGRDNFFNIFVLHQNRDYGRGKKSCVHESMIPEWMDLVIWGNEHESIPNLSESAVGTYRISQPGSSVACSLSAGESSLCPKHMISFEVRQRKFRSRPIKYLNIRQFKFAELALKDVGELSPDDAKVEETIKAILTRKVREMIDEARSSIGIFANTKFKVLEPSKVLLRLRVDHEGFPSFNHQRFGSQFVGEVANPSEILCLTKRQRVKSAAGNATSLQTELKQLIEDCTEEEIHRIRIEDLVNEALANSRSSLALLAEMDMAQALDDFIVKKMPNAIQDLVADSLEKTQRALRVDKTVTDKFAVAQSVSQKRRSATTSNAAAAVVESPVNSEVVCEERPERATISNCLEVSVGDDMELSDGFESDGVLDKSSFSSVELKKKKAPPKRPASGASKQSSRATTAKTTKTTRTVKAASRTQPDSLIDLFDDDIEGSPSAPVYQPTKSQDQPSARGKKVPASATSTKLKAVQRAPIDEWDD